MIINILKADPYEYDIEQIHQMHQAIKEVLPEDSVIITIPSNVDFYYDVDITFLKYLRSQLDNAINSKVDKNRECIE